MLSADDILHDLECYVYAAVVSDYDEKTALACAAALFQCLFLNFRKQYLYVPTVMRKQARQRHEAVWHDFSGRNHVQLSMKYHLSLPQVYAIIKIMRKKDAQRYQDDLFSHDEEGSDNPLTLRVLQEYLPHDLAQAGLGEPENIRLAQQVSDYLCTRYGGLSLKITEQLADKRQPTQQVSLF